MENQAENMHENENDNGNKNGNEEEEVNEETKIPPQLWPDGVELIIDGFGFIKPNSEPRTQGDGRSSVNSNSSNHSASIPVKRFTWKTKNRMTVQVITYGATITCIKVPDKKGTPEDVVMGFETIEEYQSQDNHYMGATIGRCAQLAENGVMPTDLKLKINDLCINNGILHDNGGVKGFDKVNWISHIDGTIVTLSHVSPCGDEGYAGTALVQVQFQITVDNTLTVKMKCTTPNSTIVNMTNHSYFNLAGHAGSIELYQHYMSINADKYTAFNEESIPSGKISKVGGTMFDFRVPRLLGEMIPRVPMGGFDVSYIITKGIEQDLTFVARAVHPKSGRVLEIYTNQPAVRFYSANNLRKRFQLEEGTIECCCEVLNGKKGALYMKHGAFCMMTQGFPNAANKKENPSIVVSPGHDYGHIVHYKFGLFIGNYV